MTPVVESLPEHEAVELSRYLAQRLKSLAIGIALLISIFFPTFYYCHEHLTLIKLLLISSCVGTGVGLMVYFLPLVVVRRMEGKSRGLLTSAHDALRESERLRAVAQGSESRFREFIQGLDAIVWEADAESWRYWFVSVQAEKILGYPVERWLAEPKFPVRHIHPDDQERVLACYQLAILEESGFQLEYRLLAADKREVWVQDFVRLSRLEENGTRQMSGIMVDITERKKTEEALAEQATELARSNAELEQFAYVASHDLQEPLRMVFSYLQLIARRYHDRLDTEGNEFLAFAIEGSRQMQHLIRDLLAYSKVGTSGRAMQPVETMAALRQALANLKLVMEENGAVVSCIELPTVPGDEMQLTQLFQNLVANAIKFRTDAAPHVEIGATIVGDEWHFRIRDNGLGIPAQQFERIFLIFQRLHGRTAYPGTGIGLAICKKIVERHGGRIWVESVQGQGSTFYFTIPVMPSMTVSRHSGGNGNL